MQNNSNNHVIDPYKTVDLCQLDKETSKKIENEVKLRGSRAFDYPLELRVRWLSTRTLKTWDSKAEERGFPA